MPITGGVFYRLLHPRPTVIITSERPDGKVDLMPASWNAPVSEEPPTIVVAVDESSYTFRCLEHSGEAAINIAPLEMADLRNHDSAVIIAMVGGFP